MALISVPGEKIVVTLQEIFLCSRFVTGPVVIGVVKNLPAENIVVCLGNE